MAIFELLLGQGVLRLAHRQVSLDGNRVKTVVGGTTTVFLGNYYEWTVSPHHSPVPLPLPKMGKAREVLQEIGTIRITRYSEMSPSNPLFTSKNIKLRAREFRKQSTTAEAVLWEQLRNIRLAGLKFRRQHPLGPFIADFYCAEKRLFIELDGGIHLKIYQEQNSNPTPLPELGLSRGTRGEGQG